MAALLLLIHLGSFLPFWQRNPIDRILVVNAPGHFRPPRAVFFKAKMQKKGRQFILAFCGPISHFPHYLSHAHAQTMPDLATLGNADSFE
jgi:hypothetical protein